MGQGQPPDIRKLQPDSGSGFQEMADLFTTLRTPGMAGGGRQAAGAGAPALFASRRKLILTPKEAFATMEVEHTVA